MSRQARPKKGETLAAYLDRLLAARKTPINSLARRLGEVDGKSVESWQRTLRRWTEGTTAAISEENAAALTQTLEADFSTFVRGGNDVRDLLTQALDRLEKVEGRLRALEQRGAAP